ncbi:neuropeptide SIFamide [Pieris napi]|uniref:neuropeptide SIFamide n=1 Tax=Pieris napi TaxID=78633 RepID=UPI001FBA9EF7|nr:neuropeptide SIFamide [Pieris napi]
MRYILIFVFAVAIITLTEATYKKIPFNGSIFGKRTTNDIDANHALIALCEITTETCEAWLNQILDNK